MSAGLSPQRAGRVVPVEHKVFLGRLPPLAGTSDLLTLARAAGLDPLRAHLLTDPDGRSRAAAFLFFGSPLEATEAVGKLEGAELMGHVVHAEPAHDGSQRATRVAPDCHFFLGNLPFSARAEEVLQLLRRMGHAPLRVRMGTNAAGRSKGWAFVDFASAVETTEAMAALHGLDFQGRELKTSPALGAR